MSNNAITNGTFKYEIIHPSLPGMLPPEAASGMTVEHAAMMKSETRNHETMVLLDRYTARRRKNRRSDSDVTKMGNPPRRILVRRAQCVVGVTLTISSC